MQFYDEKKIFLVFVIAVTVPKMICFVAFLPNIKGYSKDLMWAALTAQHTSEPSFPYSWGGLEAYCKRPEWGTGRSPGKHFEIGLLRGKFRAFSKYFLAFHKGCSHT